MKNEKQQQAKNLYFQTNLSKTEISEQIGVNRRTIMLWSQQGNWDKLKLSGRHLPSMVAEKCYYLIDHLASHLLREDCVTPVTDKDADTINKLSSSIKKLKNRSAANESMEMFNFFLDYLRKTDDKLATDILPHMERYFETRKDFVMNDFVLAEFDKNGYLPVSVKETEEKWKDEKETQAFITELQKTGDYDQALENWQNQETPPPITEAA